MNQLTAERGNEVVTIISNSEEGNNNHDMSVKMNLSGEMEEIRKMATELKERHGKVVEEMTGQFENIFMTFLNEYNKCINRRYAEIIRLIEQNEEQERNNVTARGELQEMQNKITEFCKLLNATTCDV